MFNIFFLAIAAIFLGIGLAILITRHSTPNRESLVPPEEDAEKDPVDSSPFTMASLEAFAEKICRQNGLTVKEKISENKEESYWIAHGQSELFSETYLFAFLLTSTDHPFITLAQVLEFKDFLKSLGGTKGVIFTNGYFTRDVHQPLEGPKVTLYNRLKILSDTRG